jgi:hypothetical protein
MCLENDPIEHVLIHRSRQDRLQERPRITTPQRLDAKFRQSRECVAELRSREHTCDLLRQQAAGHERECARGRTIEPLRVIHDTQERPLLRSLRQQAEGREPDYERAGRRRRAESERYGKGVPLGRREALRELKDR